MKKFIEIGGKKCLKEKALDTSLKSEVYYKNPIIKVKM